MNSCNTDIFFTNYYHWQSVRFESRRKISFARSYVSVNGSKIRIEKRTGCEIREGAKAGQLWGT